MTTNEYYFSIIPIQPIKVISNKPLLKKIILYSGIVTGVTSAVNLGLNIYKDVSNNSNGVIFITENTLNVVNTIQTSSASIFGIALFASAILE